MRATTLLKRAIQKVGNIIKISNQKSILVGNKKRKCLDVILALTKLITSLKQKRNSIKSLYSNKLNFYTGFVLKYQNTSMEFKTLTDN